MKGDYLKARESYEKFIHIGALEDTSRIFSPNAIPVSYLYEKKYEEAIDALLDAINLNYNFAFAHYHLGEVLLEIEEFDSAAQAFEVCLSMAPNISKARNYLIDLYENKIKFYNVY